MGPIGHSFSGLSVYLAYCVFKKKPPSLRVSGLAVILGNAPDFDLITAFWVGFPKANFYHHSYTHTLGFAIFCGLIILIAGRVSTRVWSFSAFAFGFATVFAHLLGDFITIDTSYPRGLMLWWPISDLYRLGPSVFLPIHKGSWWDLISAPNFNACIHETLIFTPFMSWLTLSLYSNQSKPGYK